MTGSVSAAWSSALMGRSYNCPCTSTARTSVMMTAVQRNEVGWPGDVCLGNAKNLWKTHPVWLSALQVVSAEGEKLPWVVVLQPEGNSTGPQTGLQLSWGPGWSITSLSKIRLSNFLLGFNDFVFAFSDAVIFIAYLCVCPGSRVELKTDVLVGDALHNQLKRQVSQWFSKRLMDSGEEELWFHDPVFMQWLFVGSIKPYWSRFILSSLCLHQFMDPHKLRKTSSEASRRADKGKSWLSLTEFLFKHKFMLPVARGCKWK